MRAFVFLTLTVIFGTFPSFSQDVEGKTTSSPAATINMIKVSDSIYMFKGKGGNIGVCKGEDGVLMIDNQFAPVTPEILRLVASLSDKPVQFLVNTHHHGDHTGGNANMMETGTVIFAHDNVRKRLVLGAQKKYVKAQEEEFNKMVEELAADGNEEKAEAKAKEGIQSKGDFDASQFSFPGITFSDDMTFYYNGEKIMVFHVHDAHTDGDALVYFTQSNVLHTGDTFFNGRYPYIDINSGGTYDGYVDSLNQVLSLIDDETRIIPGHGELASKADVKASRDMMVAVRDRVAYHYVSGLSKEQVLANKEVTQEYDAKGYGSGYISTEKFIGLVYDITKAKIGKVESKKK